MSTPKSTPRGGGGGGGNGNGNGNGDFDGLGTPSRETTNPYGAAPQPTYAAFSSTAAAAAKRRSTILVHQKSPLLLATPPQVTRALAYSHPFLLPLNKLAGLLSWTTGDPWESFLLLALFWATVQYGDVAVRWAGPIITVLAIIAGIAAVRRLARWVTGLEFEGPKKPTPGSKDGKAVDIATDKGAAQKSQSYSALTAALRRKRSSHSSKETGVRFTFIIYENQRRWVGLGWTNSLFAYERSAWWLEGTLWIAYFCSRAKLAPWQVSGFVSNCLGRLEPDEHIVHKVTRL
ncbi:hypothetical protein JX266_013761 [Neoarthrinium moseri]|nr:hypothetical protein JX266_013761 [Neoarthrinium moseri]